jgi:hypothetical protein
VFDGRIALLNATTERGELRLLWRADAPIGEELTRFVHLVDEDGRLRWQSDGFPRGGTYPTSIWAAGEVVPETLILPPPGDLDGSWRLHIGFYRQATLARLLRSDAPLAAPSDRLDTALAALPGFVP